MIGFWPAFGTCRIRLCACWLGLLLPCLPSPTAAQAVGDSAASGETSYFQMSLQDLMNEEVRIGSLTQLKLSEAPVPVTTITRRQIEATPARNLADLLEIYVPGALCLTHNTARVGMRGVIIDRNYKFLLLINGRSVNNKSALGATAELHNWDLNDIERVEVIRGPGSVTYGPGAIAGVVNIITRTPETVEGWGAGGRWDVEYRASGAYVQYGAETDDSSLFLHASLYNIDGAEGSDYFKTAANGNHGYFGRDYKANESPTDYFYGIDEPQLKLHLDVTHGEHWRFWARFSSYSFSRLDVLEDYLEGSYPGSFIRRRLLAAVLENDSMPTSGLQLNTQFSYDSEHTLMVRLADPTKDLDEGIVGYGPDAGNVKYNTAEHELLLRMLAETRLGDRMDLALGGSISYEWLSPSFFWDTKIKNDWIAANVGTRPAVQEALQDGFDTVTLSLFGEGNIHLRPDLDLLISGRLDKNEWSKLLLSPRVGLISHLDDRNVVRATLQRSVRMNTLVELFTDDLHGRKSEPETLDSLEVLYSWMARKTIAVQTAAFANRLKTLGWDGDKTVELGDANFAGLEIELTYRGDRIQAGLNHAFIKLLDFESKVPTGRPQGISYADYDVPLSGGEVLTDTGDSFTNYPENITKGYITCGGLPWDLTIHADMAVFWDYPGARDSIAMYEDAYNGDATMDSVAARLEDEDFAEHNILLNASIQREFELNGLRANLSLYAANLLEFRRYQYVSGEVADYPAKLAWADEPRTFGVQLDVRF